MPRLPVIVLLLLVVFTAVGFADSVRQARIEKVADWDINQLNVIPSLATADTCTVRDDYGIYYRIDGWVTGNELYKGYCDPAVSCPSPYPFTITEIHMPMYFAGASPLNVSVDVEALDLTDPGCPYPGEVLSISSEWVFEIPGAGLYDIWVPLDSPLTVNEPFFAGFFISNFLDVADSPAVMIDTVPVACMSYNIWDQAVGWVDLTNNDYWNFPGKLIMWATGIPGGLGTLTDISIAFPSDGDTVMAGADLWAFSRTSPDAVELVRFEYYDGSSWIPIGQDVDGVSGFRDGAGAVVGGDGYSAAWDASGLDEGLYVLRAELIDTAGQSSYDSISVLVEPTPPTPTITSPDNGDTFCEDLDLLMSCYDEDLLYMQAYRLPASEQYSIGVVPYGPPPQGAEYNAPAAAAQAIRLWYDRGYDDLMRTGAYVMTMDSLVNLLANDYTNTVTHTGTYDEDLATGLRRFFTDRGVDANTDFARLPDYFAIRAAVENEQKAVLLALGGDIGQWVIVEGFSGWEQPDGTFFVNVFSPLSGSSYQWPMRYLGGQSYFFDGTWVPVDLMVTVSPANWTVTRQSISADFDGADGWSINWIPTGLIDGTWYHFYVVGTDATTLWDGSSVLVEYTCAGEYLAGDYNDDGAANIVDLDYLADFITRGGPAPIGGAARSDSNCDGIITIADVVYYMNFMFAQAAPPCH